MFVECEAVAAVAQPGWSAALVRRDLWNSYGTSDGTAVMELFHNNATLPVGNPFLQIDIEQEIQEFLKWMKSRVSKKTYDNAKRYSRFIYYLAIPTSLSTALENSGLGPWGRHHVMKVLSNFAKYLDAKYTTDVFTNAWQRIRKSLGLKWSIQKGIPSLMERIEDPFEVLSKIIKSLPGKYKLFALLMAVTGLRPEEAEYLWENYDDKVREIDGMIIAELMLLRKTKNAFFSFIHPEVHELMKNRPKKWKRIELRRFRTAWKNTCQRLGLDHRKWPPYSLRKLHATLLKRVMSESDVDMLQGRVPKTVLAKHYNIESLKQLWGKYLEALEDFIKALKLYTEHSVDSTNR